MLKSVRDLLLSGMNGQMRAGDTLGLWTYNAELFTGRFPLQAWSAESQSDITVRVLDFLKNQPYEKSPSFAKVSPALERLITDSEFITVILISSGDDKIAGTPFDGPINDYYRAWQEEQQRARMPFVTVLRAKRGTITHYTVTAAPWPADMPPLPPELIHPPAAQEGVAAPKPAPAHVMVPPLIVSGRKPAQEPPAQPAPGSGLDSAKPESPPSTETLPKAESARATSSPTAQRSDVPPPVVEKAAAQSIAEPPPPPAQIPNAPATDASAAQKMKPSELASRAAPAPTTAPTPQAQTALAAPAANSLRSKWFWVAGALTAGALLGLSLFALRRTRSAAHASLITRSLDREKK